MEDWYGYGKRSTKLFIVVLERKKFATTFQEQTPNQKITDYNGRLHVVLLKHAFLIKDTMFLTSPDLKRSVVANCVTHVIEKCFVICPKTHLIFKKQTEFEQKPNRVKKYTICCKQGA